MHRTRHWFNRGLLAACAVAAASSAQSGQGTRPPTISAELRAHLQAEDFQPVTSLRGLPLGVRGALETLFGNQSLDIADPGAEFRSNGVVGDGSLPLRRLALAGCSYEHCLVYYERGGSLRTWRVVLFRWTPDATRLEAGGTAPGGLTSTADVRRLVLQGVSKPAAEPW